jgi:EAL domain-containing protein (putative c-di-GMP-specific phosphodiesterase class I)
MEPVTVRGYRVTPSVSIGIGATSDKACPPEALLCDADIALHRVKQGGGGDFELPPAGSRQNTTERLRDESDLRHAIAKGELAVHYQPLLGRDGSIVAVEALVRWPHPARGMLLPAEFIPLAEETGLIVPLGNWVLWQATTQVAAWRRTVAPQLQLGVNVSAKQLMREGWGRNVMEALAQSGLEPEALCLEITETALLRDLSTLTDAYRELRDAGVRLAIDDFGTGYASLVYLRDIPANVVKLDRLFVSGLVHDSRDAAIVRSLIQLAHALGMGTVAEGVEEIEQAKALQRLGCDFFQGFLWSKAVDAAELASRLESATVWQRDFAEG